MGRKREGFDDEFGGNRRMKKYKMSREKAKLKKMDKMKMMKRNQKRDEKSEDISGNMWYLHVIKIKQSIKSSMIPSVLRCQTASWSCQQSLVHSRYIRLPKSSQFHPSSLSVHPTPVPSCWRWFLLPSCLPICWRTKSRFQYPFHEVAFALLSSSKFYPSAF